MIKQIFLLLLNIIVVAALMGCGYYIYTNYQKQNDTHALQTAQKTEKSNYSSDVTKINNFVQTEKSFLTQLTLPNTSTSSITDWDRYYNNQISSFNLIMANGNGLTYNFVSSVINPDVVMCYNEYAKNVQNYTNDINAMLVLFKSSTELQTKVNSDQVLIKSDQNNLNNAVGDDSVQSANNKLNSDTNIYNGDNKNYQMQLSETANISTIVGTDEYYVNNYYAKCGDPTKIKQLF